MVLTNYETNEIDIFKEENAYLWRMQIASCVTCD
jgi:hypothetical protein